MAMPIVHVEFTSRDPQASGRVFAELFGWEVAAIPELSYVGVSPAGGGPGGGFPGEGGGSAAGATTAYVMVEDMGATLARAEALGAEVLMGKTEIPGNGFMAILRDPHGAQVGLFSRE